MKEKETCLSIGRINGVTITSVKNEEGKVFFPVKPVCEAIGIAFPAQYTKIKEDPSFASVVTIIVTTGADGKKYDMVCLPDYRINGWLYSINPGKVAPEAKGSVMHYRDECNDVLYRHFFNRAQRQAESNKAESAELERLRQLIGQEKEVKSQINETKKRIDSIRAARLDDQPSLFD